MRVKVKGPPAQLTSCRALDRMPAKSCNVRVEVTVWVIPAPDAVTDTVKEPTGDPGELVLAVVIAIGVTVLPSGFVLRDPNVTVAFGGAPEGEKTIEAGLNPFLGLTIRFSVLEVPARSAVELASTVKSKSGGPAAATESAADVLWLSELPVPVTVIFPL